jgi:hypothetical protein
MGHFARGKLLFEIVQIAGFYRKRGLGKPHMLDFPETFSHVISGSIAFRNKPAFFTPAIICLNKFTMDFFPFGYHILQPSLVKDLNDFFLPAFAQYDFTLHHVDLLLQFEHVPQGVGFQVTELDDVFLLWSEFPFEDFPKFLLQFGLLL